MSSLDSFISTVTTTAVTTKRAPYSEEEYEEYDQNPSLSVHIQQNPLKMIKFKHESKIDGTNSNVQFSTSSSSPRFLITSKLATSTGSVNSMGSNFRIEGIFFSYICKLTKS